MRKIFLIGLALSLLSNAYANPAYVQDGSARGPVNSGGRPFLTGTTSGNMLVVGVVTESLATITSVSDSAYLNLTWNYAGSVLYGGSYDMEIWYARNNVGGTDQVVFTTSGGNITVDADLAEYSGIDTFDVFASSANTTSANSVPITTTHSNELIYGVMVHAAVNMTAGTGFTARSNTGTGFQVYYLPEDSSGNTVNSGLNYINYTDSSGGGAVVGASFYKSGGAAAGGSKSKQRVMEIRQEL